VDNLDDEGTLALPSEEQMYSSSSLHSKEFELGIEATDKTRYKGYCRGGDCPWSIGAWVENKGWDPVIVTLHLKVVPKFKTCCMDPNLFTLNLRHVGKEKAMVPASRWSSASTSHKQEKAIVPTSRWC
jgi:hypothetical protein